MPQVIYIQTQIPWEAEYPICRDDCRTRMRQSESLVTF